MYIFYSVFIEYWFSSRIVCVVSFVPLVNIQRVFSFECHFTNITLVGPVIVSIKVLAHVPNMRGYLVTYKTLDPPISKPLHILSQIVLKADFT